MLELILIEKFAKDSRSLSCSKCLTFFPTRFPTLLQLMRNTVCGRETNVVSNCRQLVKLSAQSDISFTYLPHLI